MQRPQGIVVDETLLRRRQGHGWRRQVVGVDGVLLAEERKTKLGMEDPDSVRSRRAVWKPGFAAEGSDKDGYDRKQEQA